METTIIVIIAIVVLFFISKIDKGSKMMKYKKLYEDALKNKNKQQAIEYGRLYHKNRTGYGTKSSTNAELIIANDLKSHGIE